MKALVWIVAGALLLGLPLAQAQQVLARASSTSPRPAVSVLPPPDINDPGSKPQSIPLPSTGIPPSIAPAARQAAGQGDSTNVSSHTDANGDTVEEYRRGGVVEMVRIKPKHGPTQTYKFGNPNGSLVPDPVQRANAPIYYTLYKWGKQEKPAPASASSGG